NARALAIELQKRGFKIISDGTDTHLMLVDLTSKDVTGKEAAVALDEAGITVNHNSIPYDERPPIITSGIRLGTPIVTTRGMKEREMKEIAGMIALVIDNINNKKIVKDAAKAAKKLALRFSPPL
ncbi:MAG: serine hydroxymethyltransferase, partial [Nitrospirota bacterium]